MQKIYKKYFAIFTLPTLIAYAIAFVVPFFMGLYLSFCKFKTIGNAKWVGLSNYLYVFQDSNGFLAALWFTVKIAVVGVITTNVIAYALALLLTRGLKGTNAFRTIFFMPNLIGGIILGYIWQLLLNGILIKLTGADLTFSATYGYWGIIILYNWQKIGYLMIIYIAGIQSISADLMEAAQIDGAGTFRCFIHVVLPVCQPILGAAVALSFADCWNLVEQPLTYLTTHTELYPLSVVFNQLTQQSTGVEFAGAALYTLPALLIYLYFQNDILEGVQLTELK